MSFNILGALAARGLDANADAVSGALFYVYTEGTTTQVTTYTDSTDATANAHPVVADASGAWGGIYVAAGSYKVDIQTSGGSSLPGYPVDNVKVGAPDSIDIVSAQTITGAKTFTDTITASGGVTGDVTGALTGNASTATALNNVTIANGGFSDVTGKTDTAGTSTTLLATQAGAKAAADDVKITLQELSEATTTGTDVDVTGIQSGAESVVIVVDGVSTNGTDDIQLQLGDSGGIETSGYSGGSVEPGSATGVWSSGADLALTVSAATSWYGEIRLTHLGSNKWSIASNMTRSDAARHTSGNGIKTLSGELTQIRLTTAGGTDSFGAGNVYVNSRDG